MRKRNLYLIPGKKICRTCQIKITQIGTGDEHITESDTEDEHVQDKCITQDFAISPLEVSREEINTNLERFNISPLKSHSTSMNHISSDGKRKVNQINEVKDLTRHIENHANIPSINDSAEPSNIEKKAKDFDEVMGLIKEKI